eukprot:12836-Hanusia_phi.AAC.1
MTRLFATRPASTATPRIPPGPISWSPSNLRTKRGDGQMGVDFCPLFTDIDSMGMAGKRHELVAMLVGG